MLAFANYIMMINMFLVINTHLKKVFILFSVTYHLYSGIMCSYWNSY